MEHIYIIRTYGKSKSLIKLGYTSRVKARLASYSSTNPLYEVVQVYSMKNALQFEQNFHKKHPSVYGKEWYEEDLLPIMIQEIEIHNCPIYVESKKKTKPNLKETVLEMQKGDEDVIIAAYKKYPFLKEAIETMGYEGIEQCGYHTTNIKRKLIQSSPATQRAEIVNLLRTHGSIQEEVFISSNNLKKILKNIYETVNVTTKAKASDIEDYYHVKSTTLRINNKPVAGFIIKKKK